MTAPVDLMLPGDPQLLAAATPNPQAEAERLTRTGSPDQVRALGQSLMTAGVDLDRVYEQSRRTQRVLAGSFTNDGTPVYDEAVHRSQLPVGFRDAGTRLHDTGRRYGVVADELGSAIADVARSLEQLRAELSSRRAAFVAEVRAAEVAGGIPAAAIPALQARRAAVLAGLQEATNACGRGIAARIGRYNEVLADCRRLVADTAAQLGVAADTSGIELNPILGGRLETSVPTPALPTPGFTPTPRGPSAEVFPLPPVLPGLPGFTPAPPAAGPLINVPAPDLGAGVQDGPGSGQRNGGQPGLVDANTPPPSAPEPKIHAGQQGKHVPGHPNYQEGRGRITMDPQELLEKVGTGQQVGSAGPGEPGFRERIDFGRTIGEYVDPASRQSVPTSIGIVHHRKDGSVHVVPGRPQ